MRIHPMQVVQVPIEEIGQLPGNANSGDVEAISESIEVNGFFTPILVQRSTGYAIAGNHRLLAAHQLGAPTVPVIYLDVDDEQARRIALADNRTARLGHDDEALLAEELRALYATDVGLAGTGYQSPDFERLLRDLDVPLDFADEPVESRLREPRTRPERPRLYVTLIPQKDDDGMVREVLLARPDFGALSATDFQELREALGVGRLSREEMLAWDVPGWKEDLRR
jgi:ParB/RepB/Spo0J family partition protein